MRFWPKRRKDRRNPELEKAAKKVDDLDRRADKILRDNHLALDIKRALGAQ